MTNGNWATSVLHIFHAQRDLTCTCYDQIFPDSTNYTNHPFLSSSEISQILKTKFPQRSKIECSIRDWTGGWRWIRWRICYNIGIYHFIPRSWIHRNSSRAGIRQVESSWFRNNVNGEPSSTSEPRSSLNSPFHNPSNAREPILLRLEKREQRHYQNDILLDLERNILKIFKLRIDCHYNF